jgi:hypothetical protein
MKKEYIKPNTKVKLSSLQTFMQETSPDPDTIKIPVDGTTPYDGEFATKSNDEKWSESGLW